METERRYEALVQGDDGDELWTIEALVYRTLPEAQVGAAGLLQEYPEAARAYISSGRMVDVGTEDDPDYVFEADGELSEVVQR